MCYCLVHVLYQNFYTMGLFHLCLLVAVCLHICLNGPKRYNGKPSGHPLVQQPYTRKQFLQRRVSYSSNCDATFQVELLQNGDIEPNPGPDRQPSTTSHITRTGDVRSPEISSTPKVKYTSLELLQWKDCKLPISCCVLKTIRYLGIYKRKKKNQKGNSWQSS